MTSKKDPMEEEEEARIKEEDEGEEYGQRWPKGATQPTSLAIRFEAEDQNGEEN